MGVVRVGALPSPDEGGSRSRGRVTALLLVPSGNADLVTVRSEVDTVALRVNTKQYGMLSTWGQAQAAASVPRLEELIPITAHLASHASFKWLPFWLTLHWEN